MRSLADTAAAGWPLLASAALVLAGDRFRALRKRQSLNRLLHELRRPLQALALTLPRGAGGPGPPPLELAIAALADLDRAINGGTANSRPRELAPRPLVEAAVQRWRSRAAMAGGSIELRWGAGGVALRGDPVRFSQVMDNLIVNALEHGGPRIRIDAAVRSDRLRIAVLDDGRHARPLNRGEPPGEVIARLLGRARRGHGLKLVRELAGQQGGRFALHRSESGSMAVLELPLARGQGSIAA